MPTIGTRFGTRRISIGPHRGRSTTTAEFPAPTRIGTLALAVFAACGSPSRGQKPWPSLSGRQVLLFHASACDELTPPIHRAPPGPHTGSSPTEGPPWRAFVPGPPTDPSFDAIVVSFRCVSSGSHMFVFSSHTCPANSETSPAALTTPALDRRSLRWFGISACTATPQDLPPSLAQHGSCRRSSTSSSLPFRTHVGAHNSVVGADQGFRAPSGDRGIGTRFGTRGLSIGPHRGRSTTTAESSAPTPQLFDHE